MTDSAYLSGPASPCLFSDEGFGLRNRPFQRNHTRPAHERPVVHLVAHSLCSEHIELSEEERYHKRTKSTPEKSVTNPSSAYTRLGNHSQGIFPTGRDSSVYRQLSRIEYSAPDQENIQLRK